MLKQKSGKIINITSIAGIIGNAGQANYAASKAGLIGFTKSIAKEFAAKGFTVMPWRRVFFPFGSSSTPSMSTSTFGVCAFAIP